MVRALWGMIVKPVNNLLTEYGTTVFEGMSRPAIAHGSIRLDPGFPDRAGAASIVAKFDQTTHESSNWYPPILARHLLV